MIVKITGACQYEGCEKPAEFIASGRRAYESAPREGHHDVGFYCGEHAMVVEREGDPEYTDECPNCGCLFGCN